MTDYRDPDNVTIVRERSSGGTAVIAIIALLLIAAFTYFALVKQPADRTDPNISAAAEKVGAAADKVGDAAQDAAKKTN